MLQGAAYHAGPLYGNSHYKKFWLKKMQTEESVREPPESCGGGIFRKCSNDVNCSRLEMKGSGRTNFGVPARRSESTQMFLPSFEDENQVFDCSLSIGVPSLCERGEENLSPVVEESSSEMHKFRLQSVSKFLRTDSDLQTTVNSAEKTTEAEFSDGSVTRTCSDCKTDKTPLWRNGPNGPKVRIYSLCNACGIRFKKITKQRSVSIGDGGMRRTPSKFTKRKREKSPEIGSQNSDAPRKKTYHGSSNEKHPTSLKRSFGKDEEEGAVLLMGLSCGLVNA